MDKPKMVEVRADDLAELIGIVGTTKGDDGWAAYLRGCTVLQEAGVDPVGYRLQQREAIRLDGEG